MPTCSTGILRHRDQNQVDNFAEAKKNRPQLRPISAILATVFGLLKEYSGYSGMANTSANLFPDAGLEHKPLDRREERYHLEY